MVLHSLLYSKGYNIQECFIKDLWNSLWTPLKFTAVAKTEGILR